MGTSLLHKTGDSQFKSASEIKEVFQWEMTPVVLWCNYMVCGEVDVKPFMIMKNRFLDCKDCGE